MLRNPVVIKIPYNLNPHFNKLRTRSMKSPSKHYNSKQRKILESHGFLKRQKRPSNPAFVQQLKQRLKAFIDIQRKLERSPHFDYRFVLKQAEELQAGVHNNFTKENCPKLTHGWVINCFCAKLQDDLKKAY